MSTYLGQDELLVEKVSYNQRRTGGGLKRRRSRKKAKRRGKWYNLEGSDANRWPLFLMKAAQSSLLSKRSGTGGKRVSGSVCLLASCVHGKSGRRRRELDPIIACNTHHVEKEIKEAAATAAEAVTETSI